MTEANDYTGGVDGASNAFASALPAFDNLHWHTAHGAAEVDFFGKSRILTDTVFRVTNGGFHFNPEAYPFEAFYVGSWGNVLPLSIADSGNLALRLNVCERGRR